MNELVVTHNLSVSYNYFSNQPTFHPISFTIHNNEVHALVGTNGSGKSSILKIIAGLMAHWQGTLKKYTESIGYVPENVQLPPYLTVHEFLYFHAQLSCTEKKNINQCIDELLAQMHLNHVKHKKIRELSKGMRQRVCFIQALLGKPQLLILDEPFSGLDQESTDIIIEICFKKKLCAVLFSAHNFQFSFAVDNLTALSNYKN